MPKGTDHAFSKVGANRNMGGRPKGQPKSGGRQKGTPNALTKSAKEAFQHAFEAKGGAAGLATWAMVNETEFYKLYARLIPTDTTVKIDGMELVRESAAKIRADEKSAGGYSLEKKSGK